MKTAMYIESIERESIVDTDEIMTRVVISEVTSQCILARLLIDALGRPGVDNNMEFLSSGDRCIIVWTQPELTEAETRALITQAIAPTAKF